MSKVTISGNASGTGTLLIAAPNTNSDITLNLPTTMGTNNGSSVVTTDAAGNLGLGVAPDALLNTVYKNIQLASANGGFVGGADYAGYSSVNALPISGGWRRNGATYGASRYEQFNGAHAWYGDSAGAAGTYTPTQRMTLDASGNLGIGISSPSSATSAGNLGFVINAATAATGVQLRLQSASTGNTTSDGVLLSLSTANDLYLWNYEAQATIFGTNNIERARINSTGVFFTTQATPVSKAATVTLTGAEVLTGIVLASGTGFTLTLPTGTALDAATGGMAVDTAFNFTLIKTDSSSVTLAVNTGITTPSASQSLIISAVSSATYRLRKTAANTFVMYRIT